MNEIFDPFQDFKIIKSQYDARDLRNFAFRGLEDFGYGDFLDFLERYRNNEDLQEIISVNCAMDIDDALHKAQQDISLGKMELMDKVMASCNEFYSAKCEELAEMLESNEKNSLLESNFAFGKFLENKLQYKCDSLSEENLIEFMGKTWTYDDNNLFEAVLKQVKGNHISENNDLTGKIDLNDALDELYFLYRDGRDSGINGFSWTAEAAHFVDENKEAILNWFEEYANESSDGANIGSVLQELDPKHDAIEDLLFSDGVMTKALLARQLVYMIANDLCETQLNDYIDGCVLDASIYIESLLKESNIRKMR